MNSLNSSEQLVVVMLWYQDSYTHKYNVMKQNKKRNTQYYRCSVHLYLAPRIGKVDRRSATLSLHLRRSISLT